MQTAVVDRAAVDLMPVVCESWIDAIDRLGESIRALEHVDSNLELRELRRSCGRIREASYRLGLESSADLATAIDRLANSFQRRGTAPTNTELRAMADGAYHLGMTYVAFVAGDRLPEIKDARARLARMGERE